MPGPELQFHQLHGVRVTAHADAMDGATTADALPADAIVIRIAPDDAFVIGVGHLDGIENDDPHAIVEPEPLFRGCWLTHAQLDQHVLPYLEWELPTQRPALAQGLAAAVPIKLWLEAERTLLLISGSLLHDAVERLRGAEQ